MRPALAKLGQRGATFGKEGGSGLGVYHARTTVEGWGGTLALTSTVGEGTTVTVTLPRAEPPAWFVPELQIPAQTTIVVIDDDATIHQVWDERLAELPLAAQGISVEHFASGAAVVAWHAAHGTAPGFYLCDYELLGEPSNGLDLIEQLGIAAQAMLVTSRYEEPTVQDRCARLGVRLLPKGLAGYVPIRVGRSLRAADGGEAISRAEGAAGGCVACPEGSEGSPAPRTESTNGRTPEGAVAHDALRTTPNGHPGYRVLVLDDDEGIRLAWRLEQARLGIGELKVFPSLEACEAAQPDYPAYDFAFVDKHIPGSVWRIDQVIAHLKAAGVKRVYVASGENTNALAHDAHCAVADGIVAGKIPPVFPVG